MPLHDTVGNLQIRSAVHKVEATSTKTFLDNIHFYSQWSMDMKEFLAVQEMWRKESDTTQLTFAYKLD